MKKMLGILLVALSLFISVPQADAALHNMANDSDGTRYYLDDTSVDSVKGK